MNEPEQNQPINPDEGQEAAGAAPVSSSLVFAVGPVGTAGIRTVQPA